MNLVLWIFFGVISVILGLSVYSYVETSEESEDSKVSKKLSLAAIVISSASLFLVYLLIFTKYINFTRGGNMLATGSLISAVVLFISSAYLQKEKISPEDYDEKLKQLEKAENNINKTSREFTLIGGIVGVSVVGAYLFVLIGKLFFSKKIVKTVTIREPYLIEKTF